jgi:RimJ/RimL family protein N-acetyltransferase
MGGIKIDQKKVVLTDGKVTLRPIRMSDLKELYAVIKESAAEISAWLPFAREDYAIEETRTWLKKSPKEWRRGTAYEFAILDAGDGKIIGGCGLNGIDKMNHRANLGYWVRTSHTGRGIAPAATLLLAKWGFDMLKLNRVEILVAVENARSLRVAEKAGAKREGILRNRLLIRNQGHDAVMHSLIPGEV